jgi:hypothetical protein
MPGPRTIDRWHVIARAIIAKPLVSHGNGLPPLRQRRRWRVGTMSCVRQTHVGCHWSPVRQTSAVTVSVYPDPRTKVGTARPAAVGAIIGARSTIEAVISLPDAEFDRIWFFALSGRLTHAWMAFTRPHYKRGLVLAVSFSSEREE